MQQSTVALIAVIGMALGCSSKENRKHAPSEQATISKKAPGTKTQALQVDEQELLRRARDLAKNKEYDAALQVLLPLATESKSGALLSELSWLARLAGNEAAGLAAAKRCSSLGEDDSIRASCLYNRGRIFEEQGLLSDAIADYKLAQALRPTKVVGRRIRAAESPLLLETLPLVSSLEDACGTRLFQLWGQENDEGFETKSMKQVEALCKESIGESRAVGPALYYEIEVPAGGIYSTMAVLYRKIGASYWMWESQMQEKTTYGFEFLKTTGEGLGRFDVFLSKGSYDKGETQERYTSLVICHGATAACKSVEVETIVTTLDLMEEADENSGNHGSVGKEEDVELAEPAEEFNDGYSFRKLYRIGNGIVTISGRPQVLQVPRADLLKQ